MDIYVSISIIVLCLSAAVFFLYAIGVLQRAERDIANVSKQVELITNEVASFNAHLTPVLENVSAASENVRAITESVSTQVDSLKNVVDSVNHFANDIRNFETQFKNRVEGPVLDGAMYVSAIAKGVRTFIKVFRG